MVLFDKSTYDKLLTEAPKYKLITPSVLSDRLRVMRLILLFFYYYLRRLIGLIVLYTAGAPVLFMMVT